MLPCLTMLTQRASRFTGWFFSHSSARVPRVWNVDILTAIQPTIDLRTCNGEHRGKTTPMLSSTGQAARAKPTVWLNLPSLTFAPSVNDMPLAM